MFSANSESSIEVGPPSQERHSFLFSRQRQELEKQLRRGSTAPLQETDKPLGPVWSLFSRLSRGLITAADRSVATQRPSAGKRPTASR